MNTKIKKSTNGMIQLDITLTDNNINISHVFEIPFLKVLEINANNILVIKNLLFGMDNSQWLKQANDKVLDDLMQLKNNKK